MEVKEIAKEAEAFAEREYEEGSTDRRSLAKGFYWGVIRGLELQQALSLCGVEKTIEV